MVINIVGRKRIALVDTRVTILFMFEKAAGILGLTFCKTIGMIKTVNSKKGSTVGESQRVKLQINGWKGKEDIEVIYLDNCDFVFELEFLEHINDILVPFVDCMCIMDT